MAIVVLFVIGYFGFLFGYPLLQLWTLVRCRAWWRVASIICLIPSLFMYIFAIQDFLFPASEASLASIVVAPFGLVTNFYLTIVALGYESSRRRKAKAQNRIPAE
jgi:hypothetical protein